MQGDGDHVALAMTIMYWRWQSHDIGDDFHVVPVMDDG
jgi:hypothetical protein